MLGLPELPHSPEIERAALACMILGDTYDDPDMGRRAADLLTEEEFYDRRNVEILRAINALLKAGRTVNSLAVVEQLRAASLLTEAGGIVYVSSIADDLPDAYRLSEYVETLRDYSARRRLIDFARRVAKDASRGEVPAVAQVASATARLAEIEEGTCNFGGEGVWLDEALAELPAYLDRDPGSLSGLPTGIPSLDHLTMGFGPGQLIIVAGSAGSGKTAFTIQFVAHQLVRTQAKGYGVSAEMSAWEIALRVAARVTRVSHERIKRARLATDERTKVLSVVREFADNRMFKVDDTANSAADVVARARRAKIAHGIGYVVVDYLQLLEHQGRSENRNLEVAAASRALKRLARELEVPVIVLSQINREGQKGNERPKLYHLRDSGAIEQDADMVLFVHDPEPTTEPRLKWRVELLLEKNRHGQRGIVECDLLAPTFEFREIDRKHEVEGGPI